MNLFEIKCDIPELDSLDGIIFDYSAPQRDLFVEGTIWRVSPENVTKRV